MGRAIYKPDPALDEYLIFSTITDGPVSPVMNRKAIAQEWRDSCEAIYGERPSAEETEMSLARADLHGQSWWRRCWYWDVEEHVSLRNMHCESPFEDATCKHRDLAKLVRAVACSDWAAAEALLTDITRIDEEEEP